ncbi:MAG: PEGA domain-containing protein, partial [Isosphaeraceae bacterium]
GARIRIAGESFERTAGDVFDLGLGPHEITIVKDGYRAKVFPFELTEGEGIFEPPLIQLDQFSRRARIVGNAIGARVELDGRYSGIVTDAGIDVPLGTVKLSLTRNGFQPFERMLTVVRGDGDLILEATLPPVRRVTSIYRGIGNREVVNLYETEPLAEGP